MAASRGPSHEGIFGTPPDPLFNSVKLALPPDMLVEWLLVLASQNEQVIKAPHHKQVTMATLTKPDFQVPQDKQVTEASHRHAAIVWLILQG